MAFLSYTSHELSRELACARESKAVDDRRVFRQAIKEVVHTDGGKELI